MQVSNFTQPYTPRFGAGKEQDFAKRMAIQNRETQEAIKRSELEQKRREEKDAANRSKTSFKKGSITHPRTPSPRPKFSANA
jgi:ribosomal protein L9